MGAFFLYRKDQEINKGAIIDTFSNKGFKQLPFEIAFNDYKLILYPKIKIPEKHVFKLGDEVIIGIGTFIYKTFDGNEALKEIYSDIKRNTFHQCNVAGDFLILLKDRKDSIHLYPSCGYNYNVFYNKKESIFSSSFLAVLTASAKIVSINKPAVTEILLTGNLIGPDTIVNDIVRLENPSRLSSKDLIHHKANKNKAQFTIDYHALSFSHEVDRQLEGLKAYIKNIKPFVQKHGIALGLTGGFDSRLLLGAFLSEGIKPKIYSTWRKTKTKEFTTAEKLAEKIGANINYLQHKSWVDKSSDEISETVEENYWFNDGLIRTHQLWIEEIKSKNYHENLIEPVKINTSGIGGEQYRNNERYRIKSTFDLRKWLKIEVLFKTIKNPFSDKKNESEFIDYLTHKINNLLRVENSNRINFNEIKRYYNELYNPANRTTRNNVENQLYYFLSPFSDYQLSQTAYKAIPHLGRDFGFEKEMINRIYPTLGEVKTDYGFAPQEKVSLKQRGFSLMKLALPLKLFRAVNMKRTKDSVYLKNLTNKWDIANELIENVEKLKIPVDLSIIGKSTFLSPMIIEIGYFIYKNKSRLRL